MDVTTSDQAISASTSSGPQSQSEPHITARDHDQPIRNDVNPSHTSVEVDVTSSSPSPKPRPNQQTSAVASAPCKDASAAPPALLDLGSSHKENTSESALSIASEISASASGKPGQIADQQILVTASNSTTASHPSKFEPSGSTHERVETATPEDSTDQDGILASATSVQSERHARRVSTASRRSGNGSRPPSRPSSSAGKKTGEDSRYRRTSNGSAKTSEAATEVTRNSAMRRSMDAGGSGPGADAIPVIVRDFAFPPDDPRFEGKPHPDDLKRDSTSSVSSRLSEGHHLSTTGPGFSWGFVTSHQGDFVEEDSFASMPEDDLSGGSGDDDLLYTTDVGEFVPGVYQALYDFEPELDTEMAIHAGEVVTVISRQCAGWVQAGRVDSGVVTGEIGLVPENYLQFIDTVDLSSVGAADGSDEQVNEATKQAAAAHADEPTLVEPPKEMEPSDLTTGQSSAAQTVGATNTVDA